MSAWANVPGLPEEDEEERGHVSVAWVVLAALLMGAGIFLTLVWLITFTWPYLGGVLLMAVGLLLCFHPRAGPDRAA
jgi:hypothetical protein